MSVTDPELTVSGHSLRIGAATDLASKGASFETLKVAGRWQSDKSVSRYVRRLGLASAKEGLSTTLFK